MTLKSKNSTGATLKQGKLSFAQSKRGATATGKAKASPSLTSVKPQANEKKKQDSRTASIGSTFSINTTTTESHSDDDVELVPSGEQHDTKRLKTEAGKAKSAARAVKPMYKYKVPVNAYDSSSDDEPEEPPEDLKALEKNPRIQRVYNQAKARMGDAPPVHSKNQNKINHILRVFDTSYEYGPCVGMTRLQRWERAQGLGLNPPTEVREILLTKQGLEDDTYKQCVFYDEV